MKAAYFNSQASWQETVLTVTSSYFDLLLQKKLLEIAGENYEIGKRFLGDTELKFRQNEVPYSDVLRSRLELVQLKKELVEHEEDLKIAKNSFNVLLGRTPNHTFTLGESLPNYPSKDEVSDLEQLIAKAHQNRPDLAAINHELDMTQLEMRLSKRERIPKPTFIFWGEKDGPEKDLGLGISFDLPLWYRQKGEVLEAQTRKDQKEIQRNYLNQNVEKEVRIAYHELLKTTQKLEVGQEGLQTSAELIRTTIQNYREGKTSFLKFLETLKAVNEFKEDYFSTIALWYQQKAGLDKAIGSES